MLGVSASWGEDQKNAKPQSSWIWAYVERPQQAGDNGAAFRRLLVLSEKCAKGDIDQQFIEELLRFGHFKESGLRLVPEHVWPLTEPLYRLTVGNTRIRSEELIALNHCIVGVVKRHLAKGDHQSLDRLARGLLLFGYQLSCNGEDVITAISRLVYWDQAVEILVKRHPDDRQKLKGIRDELRREMKGEHWNGGEIRHPF